MLLSRDSGPDLDPREVNGKAPMGFSGSRRQPSAYTSILESLLHDSSRVWVSGYKSRSIGRKSPVARPAVINPYAAGNRPNHNINHTPIGREHSQGRTSSINAVLYHRS